MVPIRDSLRTGNVAQAVRDFKKVPASKDDLLPLLQQGYLSHLSGDFQDSNKSFDAAEKRFQELYTVSLSNEAFSLLTSDNSRPYRSNEQEMAMIPFYRILNYLGMGRVNDALVEARKANNSHPVDLSQLPQMSEKDIRFKAFLNYTTGLLFASQGESNDAIVSLRTAYQLYRLGNSRFGLPVPRWLAADYYDAAIQVGLEDEVKPLTKIYPNIVAQVERNRNNNVLLFLETGFVPCRKGVDIFLPLYKADNSREAARHYVSTYSGRIYSYAAQPVKLDQFLRISFPKLVPFPGAVASAQVETDQRNSIPAENTLDLSAVTDLQFKDDMGEILLRTILRTLAKQGTLKAAQGESPGLGALVNLFNLATEQADTRSWLLLPGQIDLVKMSVPAGVTSVTVQFLDINGGLVEEKSVPIDPARQPQWISVRCFK